MQKMRACIPGLSERGQPEANLEAREWHGSDVIHSGIELRGSRNCIEQSWHGDWKNERMPVTTMYYKSEIGLLNINAVQLNPKNNLSHDICHIFDMTNDT